MGEPINVMHVSAAGTRQGDKVRLGGLAFTMKRSAPLRNATPRCSGKSEAVKTQITGLASIELIAFGQVEPTPPGSRMSMKIKSK